MHIATKKVEVTMFVRGFRRAYRTERLISEGDYNQNRESASR